MSRNEYNGWTNFETWKIRLELFDGRDWCELFTEKPTLGELASLLKEDAERIITNDDDKAMLESYAVSLAFSFLARVNFHEIAESILDDDFDGWCDDCLNDCSDDGTKRWKYDGSIRLCEDCYGERLRTDESIMERM